MPYIVAAETTPSTGASATFDVPVPAGHAANDIILVIISQDGGGTTITATGYTQIGTQAQAQAQRTTAFWKLAASSSEADIALGGANDDWVVTVVVIRGANTTTPIQQNNRTDSVDSTTAYLDSGTVTTSTAACLVLYAWGFDSVAKLTIEDPNDLINVGKDISAGNVQIVGYRNQLTAGATPVLRALSEVASEGGSALVIAVVDANPSSPQMGPDCRTAYDVLKRYGGVTSAAAGTAAFIRHDAVTWGVATDLAAATIDGVDVADITTFAEVTYQPSVSPWGLSTGLSLTGSAIDNTGRWMGGTHTITSTDMSGKIFSLQFNVSNTNPNQAGPKGVVVVFEDGAGAWEAFQLSKLSGLRESTEYTAFIDLENATPYASSGTIDWTDIVRLGYLHHKRTTSTTAIILRIRNALLLKTAVLVDGCAAAPVSPALCDQVMNGWGGYLIAGLQGAGQALWKSGVTYGDGGARKTYVKTSATSHELPLSATTLLARRFWVVPADSPAAELRIDAGATDTIDMSGALVVANNQQDLVVDPGSSAAATYDFAGATIIGYQVINDVSGIAFNGATFRACHGISLLGGSLDGCTVEASATSPAVTTNDPGNISDTHFESAGTGHAIEITAAGTYAFDGNTFSGYGAGGSTDAAIYNNSGGAVTLQIGGGGDTPTIRNGAGASTTLENDPAVVSVTCIEDDGGAAIENIRVYLAASDGTGPLPFEDSVTISRSGTTATVAHTSHGLSTGDKVRIAGAAQAEYNGVFTVTVTGANAYTYTVSGSPATPATGTITATGVLLYGLTNASGVVTITRSFGTDQPVAGYARSNASTAADYYPTDISGTVDTVAGLQATSRMVSDEA